MEVHRELGCGFLEPVYQAALEMEFKEKNIPFEREVEFSIIYKGNQLPNVYRVDFLCYDSVVVEIKALSTLSGSEEAQLLNYLKASNLRTGLLLNFGKPSLEYKRFRYGTDDQLQKGSS